MASLSRRAFVGGMVGLGASALAGACAESAVAPQPSTRPWRIGYLGTQPPGPAVASLRGALLDRGLIEGRDYILEARFADGDPERMPALARELVDLQVDVIFTIGAVIPTRAAKNATKTIPIVFGGGFDPVGSGIVADLARPGGNVTGVTNSSEVPKRVELLKEILPGLTRLSVLGNTLALDSVTTFREIVAVARALGVESIEACVLNKLESVDDALTALADQAPHAVMEYHGTAFYGAGSTHLRKVLNFAIERRVPVLNSDVQMTRAGGLMSLKPDDHARWQIVARQIEKILRGANPAELPVELNDRFELVLNLATARAIGLTFPESVRHLATEVIP